MSSKRKLVFVLVLSVGLLGVAELLAHLGLAWIEGGWLPPRSRAEHQQSLAYNQPPLLGSEPDSDRADLPPAFNIPLTLHPFVGYLRDPARPNRFYDVAEDGFFAPRDEPTGEPLVVAIFGGSVANHVAFAGTPALRRHLRRASGRDVIVRSLALGGFKQPQQLTALAYLQARGSRFDVIINYRRFQRDRAAIRPTSAPKWIPAIRSTGLRWREACVTRRPNAWSAKWPS